MENGNLPFMQSGWIISFLFLLNVLLFVLMGMDKRKARKHQWRIPEKTLLWMGIAGGGLGGLAGMFFFRHKTRHLAFYLCYALGTIVLLLFIFRSFAW